MSDQLDIFADLSTVQQVLAPTPGRVHHNDPVTARQAAEKVSLRSGSQKAKVLLELAQRRAATPHELFAAAGCAYPHVATTRLHDLRDLGLVEMTPARRPTPTGGESHEWRVLPAGLAVAEQLRSASAA